MTNNEKIKYTVMGYDNKHVDNGLMMSEIRIILDDLGYGKGSDFSIEKFSDSLNGNTCAFIDGKIVNYFHDVIVAIICGSEKRDETLKEFD